MIQLRRKTIMALAKYFAPHLPQRKNVNRVENHLRFP